MKQRIAVGITTVAVAVGTAFIGIGSASAATPSASCKANGTSTISPGLGATSVPETTKLSGSLKSCTGSGKVTSGKFAGTVKGNGSCGALVNPGTPVGSGTMKVTWNNGKTSTANITLTSQGVKKGTTQGQFTLSGKVASGLFAGHSISGSFLGTPKFTGTGLPCSSTNLLKKITFSGSSTIS